MPEIQRRASSVFNPEFDFLLACCANGSPIERERIGGDFRRPRAPRLQPGRQSAHQRSRLGSVRAADTGKLLGRRPGTWQSRERARAGRRGGHLLPAHAAL